MIDLGNRIITNSGEVVAKYNLLIDYFLMGKPIPVRVLNHPDVKLYNQRNPDKPLTIWTGEEDEPAPETFSWRIPEGYRLRDIEQYVIDEFFKSPYRTNSNYINRLERELSMMQERGMYDFLRCLVYIIDVFKENHIVYGVGRGSSCSSLVLFILGVNRVDPVLYSIPIEEFLK